MRTPWLLRLGALTVFFAAESMMLASAQAPDVGAKWPETFEVASIRQQERPAFRRAVISPLPGGRFQAVNATVHDLISYAYSLDRDDLIEAAPQWATSDKFDVAAKHSADWPSGEGDRIARRMLRDLLATRFHLRFHAGKRTESGYALTLARRDGRLGPQIRKADVNCAELEAARMARIAESGDPQSAENRPGQCNVMSVDGVSRFVGHSLADLARHVSGSMRAVVIDQTGLAGPYAIELKAAPGFVPQQVQAEMLAKDLEFPYPPLEVALRDQLGLKLEKTAVEIDVITIDAIDRPTPN